MRHLTYGTNFLHLFAFLISWPPQSALLHRQAPTLPLNRWLACLTGSSILVLKLTFSPDPFPVTFCDDLMRLPVVVTHHWTYPACWLASVRWPGLSQLGQIVRQAQNSHPCLSFFFCPSKHEDGLCVLVDKGDKVVEFSCSL